MNELALQVGQTAYPEAMLFWILAPLTLAAALGMLLVKKAVHSAILMAFVMVALAVFYIAQGAPFLGIVQIVVYTGAVMMLFLFILMLVGVDSSDSLTETIRGLRPIAITAALGFGGLMVSLLGRATLGRGAVGVEGVNANGNVEGIAQLLFSTFVWPFEVVSALLITAALGAMVLANHQRIQERQLSANFLLIGFEEILWQRPLVFQLQVSLHDITPSMFQRFCQMAQQLPPRSMPA